MIQQKKKYNNSRETTTDSQLTKFSKYFIANFIGSAGWLKVMCLLDVVHLPARMARKQMTNTVFWCHIFLKKFCNFYVNEKFMGRNSKAFWHCSMTDIDLVQNNFSVRPNHCNVPLLIDKLTGSSPNNFLSSIFFFLSFKSNTHIHLSIFISFLRNVTSCFTFIAKFHCQSDNFLHNLYLIHLSILTRMNPFSVKIA